jgi:hypothetical protein
MEIAKHMLLRTKDLRRAAAKGCKRVTGVALLSLCALFFAAPARAQFIGYTFPQTVTQTLASGVACTGSAQDFNVNNLGQTQHFATILVSGSATRFTAQFFSTNGSTPISDVGTLNANFQTSITASGYYTQVFVMVDCSAGATFSINYVGTASSAPPQQGAILAATVSKAFALGAPAGTSLASNFFTPPYGNTSGSVQFVFTGAGPAGSSIDVYCENTTTSPTLAPPQVFPLATTTGVLQQFPVAALPCQSVEAIYVSGGSSASTASLSYNFTPPGFPEQFAYNNLPASSSTVVQTGPGKLHTIVATNVSMGSTITIYDNTACSGTVIATLLPTAAGSFPFDVGFQTGLCITLASVDATVAYN